MRTFLKHAAGIGLLAVVLGIAGCGDSDDGTILGGPGGLGDTVSVNAIQVYDGDSESTATVTFDRCRIMTGNTALFASLGLGNPAVTSGKLSFSLGTPSSGLISFSAYGVTTSPGDAKVLGIGALFDKSPEDNGVKNLSCRRPCTGSRVFCCRYQRAPVRLRPAP
jgi:hypothetical protein